MAKLNKNFDKLEDLMQREFNTDETIHLLIHTNRQIYMSWGVERKINFKNKGLLMYVNGHHHTGWLLIRLSWDDTYSYYLLEADKTIKKEQHNVYFDQLQELIDKDIEKLDNYKF